MFLVFALSGCAVFTSPKEKPIIEDHTHNWFGWAGLKKFTVFSTTAERREVIVKYPGNLFCAEPPPDVAESLASSFSLLAQGAAKSKGVDANLKLEATKSLSSAIRTLFTRSQGVQFMRDGAFHLCQSFLNKVIDEKKYLELYKELLEVSVKLVEKELPDMKDKRAVDAVENSEAAATEAKAAASAAADSALQAKQAADRADANAKKSEPKP